MSGMGGWRDFVHSLSADESCPMNPSHPQHEHQLRKSPIDPKESVEWQLAEVRCIKHLEEECREEDEDDEILRGDAGSSAETLAASWSSSGLSCVSVSSLASDDAQSDRNRREGMGAGMPWPCHAVGDGSLTLVEVFPSPLLMALAALMRWFSGM